MYIVLVGPSGSRKGTALNYGYPMLEELGIQLSSTAVTREALIQQLKSYGSNDTDVSSGRPQLHSSMTIFSAELTVFLGYQNRQLMSDLTDWYDCPTRWRYTTKNKGEDDILGVWVNLLGATTPGLVKETLPQEAISGGLTNRILLVYGKDKAQKVVVPSSDRELQSQLVADLAQIHLLSGEFKVAQSYLDVYGDWYLRDSDKPLKDSRFAGYVDRRATHARKLSMILNASRTDSMALEEVDFLRAVELLYALEESMPLVFEGMGRNPLSLLTYDISAAIKHRGSMTYSQILGAFHDELRNDELREVLDTLVRIGQLRRAIEGKEEIFTAVCSTS